MILNAYTVFDNKALQYHPPFFASTDGSAVRSLADMANDPSTSIGRHPSDYVLYCCGTYDDSRGFFAPEQPLRHVMDAVALLKLTPQPELFPTPLMREQVAQGKIKGAVADAINGKVR